MDAALYCKLNMDMLTDTTIYRTLDGDPTAMYSAVLKEIVERGVSMGIINSAQAEYMVLSHP